MPKEQSLCSRLVEFMASRSMGLLQVALVADVIAADARFNDWMAVEGKKSLTTDVILEIIERYEEAQTQCLRAIEEFTSTGDTSKLKTELNEALVTIGKLRQ